MRNMRDERRIRSHFQRPGIARTQTLRSSGPTRDTLCERAAIRCFVRHAFITPSLLVQPQCTFGFPGGHTKPPFAACSYAPTLGTLRPAYSMYACMSACTYVCVCIEFTCTHTRIVVGVRKGSASGAGAEDDSVELATAPREGSEALQPSGSPPLRPCPVPRTWRRIGSRSTAGLGLRRKAQGRDCCTAPAPDGLRYSVWAGAGEVKFLALGGLRWVMLEVQLVATKSAAKLSSRSLMKVLVPIFAEVAAAAGFRPQEHDS